MRTRMLLVAATTALVACGGGAPEDGRSEELVVSAAASLTDAFGTVEAAFEASRPEVDVVLNLAGSSTLRVQILEGAPVDVYASADSANMARVVAAGLVAGAPAVFARNRLQIVVPADNPAGIAGLRDLARDEPLIGLCVEEVPCGAHARRALGRAGVAPAVDSREPDVRALLTKVAAGELDAGIVYATDVAAAGDAVQGIGLPEEADVVARYPVAVLRDAPRPEAARAFVAFLLSEEGGSILRDHGFEAP